MKIENLHVFLGRMHPVHNGHKAIFKTMEKQMNKNDKALILIGSADKVHTKRNPLPISLREKLIKNVIFSMDFTPAIVPLDDLTHENDDSKEWGEYIMKTIYFFEKIVFSGEVMGNQFNKIIFHYSDIERVDVFASWFDVKKHSRLEFAIHNRWNMQEISATAVREGILNGDTEIFKNIPAEIHDWMDDVKEELEKIKEEE